MSKAKYTILIILVFSFFSGKSYAAPQITGVSGSLVLGQQIDLIGSNFGIKAKATPLNFSNHEAEELNALPAGYAKAAYTGSQVGITSSKSHSGSKSVLFDFSGMVYSGTGSGAERFPRIAFDMGSGANVDKVYVSAWVYISSFTGTATGFNWKGPILSSATNYYWSAGPNTASGFAGFYYGTPTMYWRGGAGVTQYSSNGSDAQFSYGSQPSWPADAFLFDQWQRVEWIWKSSSAPLTADGTITINRIGRSTPNLINATGIITHGLSDNRWRYVSIPQGLTNVQGTFSMLMYFDDMYIDNSLARVELCNTPTWAARTHCEIQPATAWANDRITVTLNPGSFSPNQALYVYVADTGGVFNSDGYNIAIGAVQPSAPPAPTNVTVTPVK